MVPPALYVQGGQVHASRARGTKQEVPHVVHNNLRRNNSNTTDSVKGVSTEGAKPSVNFAGTHDDGDVRGCTNE